MLRDGNLRKIAEWNRNVNTWTQTDYSYAISRYKTDDMSSRQGGPNRVIKTFEPYLESGLTPWYDIYPLHFPDEPIPTAIREVEGQEGDPVYYYYDLNGRRNMSPHDRFNIVVKQQGPHTRVTKSYRNDD